MLTLPIQIGKKYVRRDGVVVVAQRPVATNAQTAYVGLNEDDAVDTKFSVYLDTGKVWFKNDHPHDLIADAEEKPAGHPHAALMALYAQDAAETETPSERWQYKGKNSSIWCDFAYSSLNPTWDIDYQYRRKPRTIKIGDCEIQAGEQVAPAVGSPYWHARILGGKFFHEMDWQNDSTDQLLLSRGLIHLTPEAAEAHAKALIALTSLK